MVEPLKEASEGGIVLVHSDYDDRDAAGFGTVLDVPDYYMWLGHDEQEDGKNKLDTLKMVRRMEVEFKVGDRVLFRRFLRDGNKHDARSLDLLRPLQEKYPDHEFTFMHIEDILAVVTEE